MEDMCCDSDDNNAILLPVINMFYQCQADVVTKMTVGMFMCVTQNGETIPTCLFCEEAPRCMKIVWFSNNTLKKEQINMRTV